MHLTVDIVFPVFVVGFVVAIGGGVTYAVAVRCDVLPGPIGLLEIFETMFRSSRRFLVYGRFVLSLSDAASQVASVVDQLMPTWSNFSTFAIRSGTDLTPPFSDSTDYLFLGVLISRKKSFLSAFVNVISFFGVVYLLLDHFYLVRLPEVQHLHSFSLSYDAVKAYTEIVRYDEWLYKEMVRTQPCRSFVLQIIVEQALLDNLRLSKEILRILSTQHNVLSEAIPAFESHTELPRFVRPRLSYLERATEQAIRLWRCIW